MIFNSMGFLPTFEETILLVLRQTISTVYILHLKYFHDLPLLDVIDRYFM